MKTIIKIPRKIFERAKADLLRPCSFAFERVGFFSTRCSKTKSGFLVHCIDYHPVDDEHYLADNMVGVRIGPKAITHAMARAVNNSVGQIHVHWHGGFELPHPSWTDIRELPPLLRSLKNANNREVHGWMILGEGDAWSELSVPSVERTIKTSPVCIIGFPIAVNRRKKSSTMAGVIHRKPSDRYDRQSFLGPRSNEIISNAIIGIVGLGGGGSHVIQQLAHLGFKNFVLCDYDRISDSNLNRLVGASTADVHSRRLKVLIAKENIQKLHKNAIVIDHAKKWEDVNYDLMMCDAIIGCVDKFAARRDLESFCRRHMIPYLDVGMDVKKLPNEQYEIYGQVILSMPNEPCLKCMGFLTDDVLEEEAKDYGDAGNKPQVVWSNGILCSAAVGAIVDLLTDWSKKLRHPIYQTFRGSELVLDRDKRFSSNCRIDCCHFPLYQIGDPVFKKL